MTQRINLSSDEYYRLQAFIRKGVSAIRNSDDASLELTEAFTSVDGIGLMVSFRHLNHYLSRVPAMDFCMTRGSEEEEVCYTNATWKEIRTHIRIEDDEHFYPSVEVYREGDCLLTDKLPRITIHVCKHVRSWDVSPEDSHTHIVEDRFDLCPDTQAVLIQCAQQEMCQMHLKGYYDECKYLGAVLALLLDHVGIDRRNGGDAMDVVYGFSMMKERIPQDLWALVIKLSNVLGDAEAVTVEVPLQSA